MSRRSLTLLIKPASSCCNLRCRYCFYADEAANRSAASMGIMQGDTAEVLIRQSYAMLANGGSVSFMFQGGEPTAAGLDFFESFTAMAAALRPKNVAVSYAIQTNGTLLDARWAALFKRYSFLVGLSLDGYAALHDLYRVDAAGSGSFAAASRALRLLQNAGVPVNALCVVTAQCARHPDKVYTSLKRLGVGYMQFIPCLDSIGEVRGGQKHSLLPQPYGDFLCRLFDAWYADWRGHSYHSIRLFEDYISILQGEGGSTCATCGRCGSYFVVEGDGSVYPCDFYALDEWKLGNIRQSTLAQLEECAAAQKFMQYGAQKPAECAACRWRPLCNGGCKNDWYAAPDGAPHNYYCPAFRRFFAYAEARLLEIARAEQAAKRAGR